MSDKHLCQCVCGLVVPMANDDYPLYCFCGNVTYRSNDEMPGFWRRANTFARSAFKHVVTGLGTTPKDELLRRKRICGECEFNREDKCLQCGCRLAGWPNKLEWASERCPIGKWEAVEKK